MLSTKATTLLLFAIIGVSFADPLQDRRSNDNSTPESSYGQNPDHQNLIKTASQYGQNPGHQNSINTVPQSGQNPGYQNSATDTRRNDRQSYPQKPISNGSLNNQSPSSPKPPFIKPIPEMKPFKVTPDVKKVYKSIDSQGPAGSEPENYIGSIIIQKDSTYNTDPNSMNIHGSVTHISGMHVSPVDQKQIDSINKQSLSLDDSEPKSYQTRDEIVNEHGAVTYQKNKVYPYQSQSSIQQYIRSRQTTSTQLPAQESPETRNLSSNKRCLQVKFSHLAKKMENQNAELKRMESSLNLNNQILQRIETMVRELIDRARDHP
uniref:CrV2 n=1 Tax=Bracoviriform rubeculae TaxID=47223 RepID=Q6GW06_9VIRU|nr:CrV2 [Bracoviriform rubeculae]